MVAQFRAYLPHACVGLPPGRRRRLHEIDYEVPHKIFRLVHAIDVDPKCVQKLPVNIVLALLPRGVPDAYGLAVAPPRRWGRTRSDRSISPPTPYMICSGWSWCAWPPAEATIQWMKFSISSEHVPTQSVSRTRLESRIHE